MKNMTMEKRGFLNGRSLTHMDLQIRSSVTSKWKALTLN
jgi:hypothetical protein